jgi:subtilisin family serine protease
MTMRRFAALTLYLITAAAHAQAPQPPNDPLSKSRGTWGQAYEDQWGLHRIGPTWTPSGITPRVVTVAVIDTGLDYTHPDFARDSLWMNAKEKLNGVDDDRNGFIDDVVGWNFAEDSNNPWDRAGHGTFIAGIIAAASDNQVGIAGLNPHARIMPLAVLNAAGHGRSSQVAAAIHYAIANGAQVINLSLGSENLSALEEHAIRRALEGGVIVVVASGNLGRDTRGFGLADLRGALVVAATDPHDQRAKFSNYGANVSIAAPGVDILGLRARESDFVRASRADTATAATTGGAIVGPDGHYYRASGTSFAAAFVSGVASWLLSVRPELTGTQVTRMLTQSARDVGVPGIDSATGYGLIDARAAFTADPEFWIASRITKTEVQGSAADGTAETTIRLFGSSDASRFAGATLRAAPEAYPDDWISVATPISEPVRAGLLGSISLRQLQGARRWIVQLRTKHENGRQLESRMLLDLGEAP